jgi:hypothetical protein
MICEYSKEREQIFAYHIMSKYPGESHGGTYNFETEKEFIKDISTEFDITNKEAKEVFNLLYEHKTSYLTIFKKWSQMFRLILNWKEPGGCLDSDQTQINLNNLTDEELDQMRHM